MAAIAPLAMSQTKDDLLKHLNLPPETYALMAVCRSLPVPHTTGINSYFGNTLSSDACSGLYIYFWSAY
jgi:hypothetical protein